MSENLMNSANSQNDEIDIFELLGKIWKGKFSIIVITLAFFALGVLYTIIATPWYSAKARISVPYYKNLEENKKELLVEADMIINKIQSKYIDALKGQPKESAFVEKIAPAKISGTKNNLKDFLDIEVMGKSNDEAIALINQIVKEEQEANSEDVQTRKRNVENKLHNVEIRIKFLQNNIEKLQLQSDQIDTIFMPNKDKEIANLQNTVLPNDKKAYDELINKVIPNLENEMQNIEKELKNPNLNQNNAIILKERLNDLRNRYMSATTTTKQKFEHDLHDSEFVKIPNLLKDKENLVASQTDILNKIDEKSDEIIKLKTQQEILQASLAKQNLSNVVIKDDLIVTNEKPVKPKKLLIVAIVTFLGGVLGVFWVLSKITMQNIKNRIKNNV
ncbi:Wzz/FepE/Etk N-terminal domain-containing protein [Campylobacter sp. VBCF_06 NA8]|uniref:Wzz/FepE/Etk N-terminal domain-containing protein n=1 Tax=Campylobacter sp. VBCF_06 NA8 TaxID=2983822 RepID=UPI0022E9C59B|nr:Wzz/FepE/Etk N-terminal domain-containing protein [Campylobacter sp. VBCF_06 NA8]MDA3046001.1 Wzz/FepE/Etk N-terminal domain-containing protein [Campylobacter sp. VBCF_06 NA8]